MGFALDISKFVEKCGANADAVVRKTVLDIGRELVERTPVGDATYWQSRPPKGYVGGHARANWAYGLNAPVEKEFPDIDKTGQVSIVRINNGIGQKAAMGVHYISNSVPYIERLEDGWSRQAPNGMVGLTVIKFQAMVDNAAKGLK